MSILSRLFGGGKNPADAARPYLDQIPGVAHQTYDPYISEGRGASQRVGSEYGDLLDNPTALIDKIMGNYHPSEGYNFEKTQLQKELKNASAAGGIAGTEYDVMRQGQGIQGLLSKDMEKYLQNALGLYRTGLTGEQGIADTGYKANEGLGTALGNNLSSQAGLAFKGQSEQNAQRTALIGAIAKALGAGAGAIFGPGGALAGGALGSSMFGGG